MYETSNSTRKFSADQVRELLYSNKLLNFGGVFLLVFASYASFLRATWGLHVEALILCVLGSVIVAGYTANKLAEVYVSCTSPVVAVVCSSGFVVLLGIVAALVSALVLLN
ncbi:MAG: hypothetical protein OXG08_01605 [Gammaproteobacteria bacterium]|nr:hypothetical protein [Gammaproteobacteria bacterium]